MKLYESIGSVTLSRSHPSYQGARLIAIEGIGDRIVGLSPTGEAELVIAWDDLGAGLGSQLAVSDGAEAAQAFRPEMKAVDAYVAAILDTVTVDKDVLKQLKK